MNISTFEVDFLSSPNLALTKQFSAAPDGTVQKTPYPNAFNFTSHRERFSTLEELRDLIEAHGAQGHCMLKGLVQRPLVNESRRGSTDRNASTKLLVLDLDQAPYELPDEFMILHKMAGISYLVQYSSSSGLKGSMGLSCHIFILLTNSVPAAHLKTWLMHMNLTSETLRQGITLSRTGAALHWPLDITACQNDKLIYIAPPIFNKPLKDPLKERLTLHVGRKQALDTRIMECKGIEVQRTAAGALRNELRVAAGMKGIGSKTKFVGEFEVQPRPGEAVITGMREERGFVYFNLNGGDSWGYYHPTDNFEYIHNFKGEPAYYTKELLPGYYSDCSDAAQAQAQALNNQPTDDGEIILAFRDFKTATYFNGTWNPKTMNLELAVAKSETQLDHYLQQYGRGLFGPVPVWDMVFDPHNDVVVDVDNRQLNTYVTPKLLRATKYTRRTSVPPIINQIFTHAVGTGKTLDHWLNWLAVIFQYRIKTQTAWCLQGTEGTGKGLIANHILTPIFSREYVAIKRARELLEVTNAWVEKALFVIVDEMQTATERGEFMLPDLRNMITEPEISIRHMYRGSYNTPNYSNYILNSNLKTAIALKNNDRRYNIGEFQRTRLELTEQQMRDLPKELPLLVDFLMTYKADVQRARTVIVTEARAIMIANSRTSYDAIADAIKEGDIDMLWDSLPDSHVNSQLAADPMSAYGYAYAELIHRIVRGIAEGTDSNKLTRDELMTIFEYTVGNTARTPHKFTTMLKHYDINTKKIRIGEDLHMGIDVKWKTTPEWLAERMRIIDKNYKPSKLKKPQLTVVKR